MIDTDMKLYRQIYPLGYTYTILPSIKTKGPWAHHLPEKTVQINKHI